MTRPLTEECVLCLKTIYNVGLRDALDDEAERLYGHLPDDQTVPVCPDCYLEFKAWRDSSVVH